MNKEYETIMRLNNGFGNINDLNLNHDIIIKNNKKRRIENNKIIETNIINYNLSEEMYDQLSKFRNKLDNYINNLCLNYTKEELNEDKSFKEIIELINNNIYNILKNCNKLKNLYYEIICDRSNNYEIDINKITIHIIYEIDNHIYQPKFIIKNNPYKVDNTEEFNIDNTTDKEHNCLKPNKDISLFDNNVSLSSWVKLSNNKLQIPKLKTYKNNYMNKYKLLYYNDTDKNNSLINNYYILDKFFKEELSNKEIKDLYIRGIHKYNSNNCVHSIHINTKFFDKDIISKLEKNNLIKREYKIKLSSLYKIMKSNKINELLKEALSYEISNDYIYTILISPVITNIEIIKKLDSINIIDSITNITDEEPKIMSFMSNNNDKSTITEVTSIDNIINIAYYNDEGVAFGYFDIINNRFL